MKNVDLLLRTLSLINFQNTAGPAYYSVQHLIVSGNLLSNKIMCPLLFLICTCSTFPCFFFFRVRLINPLCIIKKSSFLFIWCRNYMCIKHYLVCILTRNPNADSIFWLLTLFAGNGDSIQIFCPWAYLMKVIPETHRVV
jgi:hypothetical protein